MSKEVRSDSGQPPHRWISAPFPQGGGPHLAFMPDAVIQISTGTVHGLVTHGNDPRWGCPVLIGFLQRRAQCEGQGLQEGEARQVQGGHPQVTWRLLSSQQNCLSTRWRRNGERNIPQWRRKCCVPGPDPSWKVKGQGSKLGSLLHLPSFRGGRPVPQLPPGYLYHRPSLFPGMLKRAL